MSALSKVSTIRQQIIDLNSFITKDEKICEKSMIEDQKHKTCQTILHEIKRGQLIGYATSSKTAQDVLDLCAKAWRGYRYD